MVNPFNRFKEKRRALAGLKEQMLLQKMAEQQAKPNNERAVERILETRRQEGIRKQLLELQKQEQRQMFSGQNILNGNNAFQGRATLLNEQKSLLKGSSILKSPNLFGR